MLTLDVVNEFVMENFQKVSISKNGSHFHARCPLCGDSLKSLSKKRFHLDWNGGNPFWHCFNCDRSGSFLEIYSELKNITIEDAKKELFKFDVNYLTRMLSSKKKEKLVKEIEYENHNYILEDSIGLHDEPKSYIEGQYKKDLVEFVNERMIPESFPVMIAYKGDYKGRIIIPIYSGNDIVYFQGRVLHSDDYKQKYKNPTLQKGHIVLNKDNFDSCKYIVVTEGLFDAAQVGDQGTSCLGASVSEDFISMILPLTKKGVIIALDNDTAGKNGMEKILKENKYANLLRFFIMPYKYKEIKDLNELKIKNDKLDIYQFVVDNSHSAFETKIALKL